MSAESFDLLPELSATMPSLVPPPILASTAVKLQISERRFLTTIETLTRESLYFQELLLDPMSTAADVNGTVFIDADGETFDHILQYLRYGIYPVFYDAKNGHDFTLYLLVLQQARMFQIQNLVRWI
ncbi:MAG: hypothetical protein MMC33_006716 [Icmadophila ericetorum]|nr:hypothetical protein [Icmadophila ericetorum]